MQLLIQGCTETPLCRCGQEMRLYATSSVPREADTHIRIYTCPACHHELRLTMWGHDTSEIAHATPS